MSIAVKVVSTYSLSLTRETPNRSSSDTTSLTSSARVFARWSISDTREDDQRFKPQHYSRQAVLIYAQSATEYNRKRKKGVIMIEFPKALNRIS